MTNRIFPPWRCIRLLGYSVAVALLLAPTAIPQELPLGNVFVTVTDNQGAGLPGATVTLSGIGAPQVRVTDRRGDARFIRLDPGRYTVQAELSGFGTVSVSNVNVNIGRNTQVDVTMQPAVAQTITVTAETPLLDVRRAGTGATVPNIELKEIPTARDPWVILQQVPGVMLDRINVGGNESGQQSVFIGKGTTSGQNSFNVDGVTITDMAASGSSPTYYDFDMFEEMQVSTGGSDPRLGTPGVSLNMVTKRGTNEFRGSGRYFLTDNDFQADPEIPAEATSYLARVNEIDRIEDFGGELGGPILRDRLWFWLAYGENQIGNLVASGAGLNPDFTLLENENAKLNAQILSNNSATGFYTKGDKIKSGRGAGLTRPPETTWDQSGPTTLLKFEDTHIFSPNFYLTVLWSDVDGGFQLFPKGGLDVDMYFDVEGVAHNSFYLYGSERPQEQYRIDGSTFFDTGALNHELKFGFSYRDTPVSSLLAYPGSGNYGYFLDETGGYAYLWRDGTPAYGIEGSDIYLGDTIMMGNLTIQAGLRYDQSEGRNLPSTSRANPTFPNLLPAINFAGDDQALEWTSISPRLGVTYAFGEVRRSLVRAAYNRYAGGVSSDISTANAVPLAQFLLYYWTDANQDTRVQPSELGDFIFAYNVNTADPGSVQSPTRIDYDMDPPTTDELLIGFEHELLPEFTIGLNYTHREAKDFAWFIYEKTKGAGDFYGPADFEVKYTVSGTLPNGQTYSEPVYGLKTGRRSNHRVMTNRPGYERIFDGLELMLTKRLSNRWMMRGSFSWNDWTQEQSDRSFVDPTNQLSTTGCLGRDCDGEMIVEQSGGSGDKGNVFLSSTWSYNITGMYQLPWGFNIGGAIIGREGYPLPYIETANVNDGYGRRFVLASGIEPVRMEDIFNVDLRLSKEFRLFNRLGLTLSADAFNVTDERTILQRDRRLTLAANTPFAGANRIREIQSPRVIRFGARISF